MDRFTTWRNQAFATENFPWGSFREQKERLTIVALDTKAEAQSLVRTPRKHVVLIIAIILGLTAILGDSFSTLLMADLANFYESNVIAAELQRVLGLPGYVILGTILSLCLLPLLLVRGSNVIAWILLGGGITFLVFKAYVAFMNFQLLYMVLSAP